MAAFASPVVMVAALVVLGAASAWGFFAARRARTQGPQAIEAVTEGATGVLRGHVEGEAGITTALTGRRALLANYRLTRQTPAGRGIEVTDHVDGPREVTVKTEAGQRVVVRWEPAGLFLESTDALGRVEEIPAGSTRAVPPPLTEIARARWGEDFQGRIWQRALEPGDAVVVVGRIVRDDGRLRVVGEGGRPVVLAGGVYRTSSGMPPWLFKGLAWFCLGLAGVVVGLGIWGRLRS